MSFAIGDSGIILDDYNKKIRTNFYINEDKTAPEGLAAAFKVDFGVVKSTIPEFNDAFTFTSMLIQENISKTLFQGYNYGNINPKYDYSNCCCLPAGIDSSTGKEQFYEAGLIPSSMLSCSTEQTIEGDRYFINGKISLERISKNVFAVHLTVSIEEGTDDTDNVPGYLTFSFDMSNVFDVLRIYGPDTDHMRGIGQISLMEVANQQISTGKFKWATFSIEDQNLHVSLMQNYRDMHDVTRLTFYEGNGYIFIPDEYLIPLVDNRPEPVRPARHILGNVNLDNVTTAIDGVDYDQLKCILYDKNEENGYKYSFRLGDGDKKPFGAEPPTTTTAGLIPIKPFVGEDAEVQPGCSLLTKDGVAYPGWSGKQETFEGDLIIAQENIVMGDFVDIYEGPCTATFCQVGNNKILIFIPTDNLPLQVDTFMNGDGLVTNLIQLNIDWQEALWKFGREMILDQQMNYAMYDAVAYQCTPGAYQASITPNFNHYDSLLGQSIGYYSYGYNKPDEEWEGVPLFKEGYNTIVIELTFFDSMYNDYQD